MDPVITLALEVIEKKKQAIVFANSKRGAEKTAEDIAKKTKDNNLILSEEILRAVSKPTKQCERLAKCVRKGVAFHHAGLVAKQRELIEDNFKTGVIKIIAATPTLAIGVDLPAFRVIMKDLRRFTQRGMQFIPTLEYMQMIGRAGRPKYDTEGEAICIAKTDAEIEEIETRYIYGSPEDIYSKLAVEPVLRTYLLSLIASNYIGSKTEIVKFFSETFWAHQFKDMEKLEFIIDKMLSLLTEWNFIETSNNKDGFLSADEYGNANYKTTPLGKRVSELYLDPFTANHIITSCKRSEEKTLVPFSLLQMVSHTLEMRPLLNIKTSEMEIIDETLVEYDENIIDFEPTMFDYEYKDFLSSVKTALFMQRWIDECDEEFLLEKFNIRPGEIKVKLDNADWLLYATEELARIKKMHKIISEVRKLRVRLKYGVKEELLPLLKLKNIGRARARSLYKNKIKDIKDVKSVDLTKLSQIIGKAIASNIKEQVGEKVIVIKENKRKGQISLNDY